jgi:hypothetical protein
MLDIKLLSSHNAVILSSKSVLIIKIEQSLIGKNIMGFITPNVQTEARTSVLYCIDSASATSSEGWPQQSYITNSLH